MKVLLRIACLMGVGFLFLPVPDLWSQNTNADYAGAPPFISATVIPNILLLMDNSGSMILRVDCPNDPVCPAWDPRRATPYSGLFDPEACYQYDASDTRFRSVAASSKAFNVGCGNSSLWDGNFLNWITYRRMDSVKKAMIGGYCAVGRAPDGTCPASGSPGLVTLKGESVMALPTFPDISTSYPADTVTNPFGDPQFFSNGCPTVAVCPDRGVDAAAAATHVPSNVMAGLGGGKLYFHLRGTGALAGSFCVDNDMNAPPVGSASCDIDGPAPPPYIGGVSLTPGPPVPDADGFLESRFVIHVALDGASPLGVIQKVGAKARLGLMVFRENSSLNDGGKVLVPIGGRQVVPFDSTTVTTWTDNTTAMLVGVETASPSTFTPLAEWLYTAIRYIAQVPQPYDTAKYMYPLAFAPGVSYQAIGQGSIQGSGRLSLNIC